MFYFFFFKQKTAYEMRISDWSSDVCSSDLISVIHSVYRPEIHEMNDARAILSQEAPAVFGRNGSMCEPATHAPWAGMIIRRAQAHGVSEPAEQAEESGRASCRERVCQYGTITVYAVSSNKKYIVQPNRNNERI